MGWRHWRKLPTAGRRRSSQELKFNANGPTSYCMRNYRVFHDYSRELNRTENTEETVIYLSLGNGLYRSDFERKQCLVVMCEVYSTLDGNLEDHASKAVTNYNTSSFLKLFGTIFSACYYLLVLTCQFHFLFCRCN